MSKSAERCLPFFTTLRNVKDFQWTDECQTAFDQLKAYIQTPPLLSKPESGEDLYLHLAVGPAVVSSVLVRQEGKTEHPIYYVSRVLHDAKTRYQEIEKFAFAVVTSARKLRPYFQAHPITVLIDQPLQKIMQKPDTSGRLINWAIELGEFDIQIKPRPAIKSKVLADFVAEHTVPLYELEEQDNSKNEPAPDPPTQNPLWMLFVDGSATAGGSGAGLVLAGPDNFLTEYALKLDFKASKNEAEYEALIAGITLATELHANRVRAHSDSQLVLGQVNGFSEAKEERMLKYLEKVRKEISAFEEFQIVQIPQTMNARTDTLSKMASSGIVEPGNVFTENLSQPSIEREEILQIEEEPSWMDPIV
ncbi:uncharacterized protein LOC143891722 [Tasmannia lanceolata]|uniref:uncharacterized protein LOC143891722 n=1 Tax=Tasmannia lanceolata TaxID=3420 RepID=UPI0040646AEA